MKLLLKNQHASVLEAPPLEYRALRAWVDTLARRSGIQGGLWDGSVFPAGLAVQAARSAPERVYLVEPTAVDVDGSQDVSLLDVAMFTGDAAPPALAGLRPYQVEAVDTALRHRRGILKLPPGAGKTRVAAALIEATPAIRWTYLVSSRSLADQAYEAFRALGVGASRQAADREARVLVLTTQHVVAHSTNGAAPALLREGLLVDEVQSAGAATVVELLRACRARYRVGLSATPLDRPDGRNVAAVAWLGPVVYERTAVQLVEQGYLSAGLVEMRRFVHEPRSDGFNACYDEVYESRIVRCGRRNTMLLDEIAASHEPRLVLTQRLDHGVLLQERLRAAGIAAEFVSGDHAPAQRDVIFARVRRDELRTLVVSPIGGAGLDLPNVATVINAGAGKSAIRAIQGEGRGTRLAPDKHGFVVVDVFDVGHRWLERHARARAAAYGALGYLVDAPEAPGELATPEDVRLLRRGPSFETADARVAVVDPGSLSALIAALGFGVGTELIVWAVLVALGGSIAVVVASQLALFIKGLVAP